VRVGPNVPNGTQISNQAVFQSPSTPDRLSNDPTTPAQGDPTVVVVNSTAGPDFSATTKFANDVNGSPLSPGEQIEYVINVPNSGSASSASARLFESIPANTSYVAGSTTLNGLTVGDGPGGQPPVDGMLINGPGQAPGVIAPD